MGGLLTLGFFRYRGFMDTSIYQYDVAFSFVAQDEPLTTELADQFEGRLKVFLYSRKQEQLAGTDGEKSFNAVFSEQSRLVVVLYRDGWGQTPWTRIEETAIRNRAFEHGYGFVMFIPLDDTPSVPKWLPRTQLWIGLKRWGVPGAASVIDARIQEMGGEPTDETIEHRAARVERSVSFAKTREAYLASDEGVRKASEAFESLQAAILSSVPKLQTSAPSLGITEKHANHVVALLATGPALSVSWRGRFCNTLSESFLEASVWNGHPPFPGVQFWEAPRSVATLKILPDLSPSNEPCWAVTVLGKSSYSIANPRPNTF